MTKKIDAVTESMGKGHFDVVTHSSPCPPLDERPIGKIVGLDLMFEKVRRCLEDERVRSIGFYVIGGVGKITLLKKINNEYCGTTNHRFDVVIWIVVSKPINIAKIQQAIMKKLRVPDKKWEKVARRRRLQKYSGC